jgi:hypothetical protein
MLNPTPTAEKQLVTALRWMRDIDDMFESFRGDQPEWFDLRKTSFELLLLRQLEYLRTYGTDRRIAVTMNPNTIGCDLDFSLLWAEPDRGPFMNGLLHWNGPLPGKLTMEMLQEAPTWEWSVHT